MRLSEGAKVFIFATSTNEFIAAQNVSRSVFVFLVPGSVKCGCRRTDLIFIASENLNSETFPRVSGKGQAFSQNAFPVDDKNRFKRLSLPGNQCVMRASWTVLFGFVNPVHGVF